MSIRQLEAWEFGITEGRREHGLNIAPDDWWRVKMSTRSCGCDPDDGYVCEGCTVLHIKTEALTEETRSIDPTTGGQKGTKIQKFSLIPAEFLWALATHYGIGAKKYADRNWEKGYRWSLSIDALERHLNAWKMGETYDMETGSHHLIAVAWHACALFIFQRRVRGTDDVRTTEMGVKV